MAEPLHLRVHASALCASADRGSAPCDRGLSRLGRGRARHRHSRRHAPAEARRGIPSAAHADAAGRAGTRAGAGSDARRGHGAKARRRAQPRAAMPCSRRRRRERDFLARRSFAVLAGRLQDARQLLQRRRRQERGAALAPELAGAELAWRSRLEPSGVCESLRCSERTVLRPSLREHSRRTEAMRCGRADVIAGGEQVAGVQAHAEALARRRRRRCSAASSSKERPSVPPAPAVFSRCSSQPSLSASAAAIVLPARAIASPTWPCFAEPGCSTTPAAPIACPTRNECVSDASDLARISAVLAKRS